MRYTEVFSVILSASSVHLSENIRNQRCGLYLILFLLNR